ncbi:MAG: segregation/condensation protein A [Actinomycetota bacterium]|nr:segregation/condensation protein A [Actinomycetota bacterium]
MGEVAHAEGRPAGIAAGVTGDSRTRTGRGSRETRRPQPAATSSYHVRIDGFEGPFGLLLGLIARRKLEISEVDLAEITGDFLSHLGRLEDDAFDLDAATHFLVVAATLVELKAVRLLPSQGGEQLDEILMEARDLLYARLLEFRAFQEVSWLLAELLESNEGYISREVPLERPFRDLVPAAKRSLHADDLGALAAAVLAPKATARVSIEHIRHAPLSVSEATARLLARLRHPGEKVSFKLLVRACTRGEQVVHFLALLELFKLGFVDLNQVDCRAPVEVERRDPSNTTIPDRIGAIATPSPWAVA